MFSLGFEKIAISEGAVRRLSAGGMATRAGLARGSHLYNKMVEPAEEFIKNDLHPKHFSHKKWTEYKKHMPAKGDTKGYEKVLNNFRALHKVAAFGPALKAMAASKHIPESVIKSHRNNLTKVIKSERSRMRGFFGDHPVVHQVATKTPTGESLVSNLFVKAKGKPAVQMTSMAGKGEGAHSF